MSRVRRVRTALQEFIAEEAASGIVLVLAIVVGLVWFNVHGTSYARVFDHGLLLDIGPIHVDKSISGWIESGLMTVFFFVVGLELKREIVVGELRDPKVAIVPIAAAIGGMIVPAVLYLVVSAGAGASEGWGVPVATDIALVLGLLALLGARVSSGLKLFMLTLAIVDDLLGIAAIAIFYTDDLELHWLLGAAGVGVITWWSVRRFPNGVIVLVGGVTLWYLTYQSGVKPALAGAALGLLIPAGSVRGRELLADLEHRIHPWSAFVVLPLFGIASAAIDVSASGLSSAFGERVTWAVVVGSVGGKLIGIIGATTLVVARGRRLPEGMRSRDVAAGAALGGVGFSVAMFIASAAFEGRPEMLASARVGVLAAGILAASIGVSIITFSSPRARGASIGDP